MRRAFRFGGRRHVVHEVDEELAFHIDMRVGKLVSLGMAPDDARREALRQFGDLRTVRESCITEDEDRERAMQRANRWDEIGQDLRYALRMLRRAPVFTAVVVSTLALGIGANASIFTLIDAVIRRPIPVRNPQELVAMGQPWRVWSVSYGVPRTDLYSYPLYRDLREQNTVFAGLLASARTDGLEVRLGANAEPTSPRGRLVSGNYFQLLGVGALLGRTFDAREDAGIGASPVVVLSADYWTRAFDRDPAVVGRSITINDNAFTVVGVAADDYTGEIVGMRFDMWLPLTMQQVLSPNRPQLADRNANALLLLGRLKPGVSFEQAQATMVPMVRQAMAAHATRDFPVSSAMESEVPMSSGARGFSRVRQTYTVPLYTLMAGVALLLLIVCSNVANLLLARAVTRQREMGIRSAIGAARPRIVRQLLTECAVLAVLSAAAGLLVSWWGSRLLLALASTGTSGIPVDIGLNLPVLAFTGGIALLAVGIFGLVPALRASRVDLAATLRSQGRAVVGSGRSSRRGSFGGGRILIVGQVAVSLVLLLGAGLLVRSLIAVQNAEVAMARDHLITAWVDATGRGYRGERARALIRDLTMRFERTPGVEAVTFSSNGIFSGIDNAGSIQVPGFAARAAGDSIASTDNIGPGWVRAVGGRLLAGREFTVADDHRAASVALVNERFATFYFGGSNPIGRTFSSDTVTYTIVGLVADIPYHDLTEEPERRYYLPFLQYEPERQPGSLIFIVRAEGDPARLVTPIRAAIRAADLQLNTDLVQPLSVPMQNSISQERLVARLATGFGAVALLLAALGLYGVLTYAVTRRTNEIGLRVALGASRRDVVRMIVKDALMLVVIGVALGAPLAVVAIRLLRGQLHGVAPTDPVAIGAALIVLTGSALLAALLPARRASRLDPLSALRAE